MELHSCTLMNGYLGKVPRGFVTHSDDTGAWTTHCMWIEAPLTVMKTVCVCSYSGFCAFGGKSNAFSGTNQSVLTYLFSLLSL